MSGHPYGEPGVVVGHLLVQFVGYCCAGSLRLGHGGWLSHEVQVRVEGVAGAETTETDRVGEVTEHVLDFHGTVTEACGEAFHGSLTGRDEKLLVLVQGALPAWKLVGDPVKDRAYSVVPAPLEN